MNYFIKSLVLHIAFILLLTVFNKFSFKRENISSVSVMSYSQLQQYQADFAQAKKEQAQKKLVVKKQDPKPKKEPKKKKPEPKKAKEEKQKVAKKPQPKKEAKQTPKTQNTTTKQPNTESAAKKEEAIKPQQQIQPQPQTQETPSLVSQNTNTSKEVVGNYDFSATQQQPTQQESFIEESGEISGSLEDAFVSGNIAVAENTQPQEETKEEPLENTIEEPTTSEPVVSDEDNKDGFDDFLDTYVESANVALAENSQQGGGPEEPNQSLTDGEYNALVAQIKSCWFFTSNVDTEEDVEDVQLKLKMNKDATVANIQVVGSYNSYTKRVLLRHAISSLKNPKCVPLKLPLDKYDVWKEITINFSNRI